jgi:hypothetical protein
MQGQAAELISELPYRVVTAECWLYREATWARAVQPYTRINRKWLFQDIFIDALSIENVSQPQMLQ